MDKEHNLELIKHLDNWEKDIKKHLKDMKVYARAELCIVLSDMLDYKNKLKEELENEC